MTGLSQWPTAYPRSSGPWTARRGDQWGVLDPELGRVAPIDPATDPTLPGIATAIGAGELIGYRHQRRAIVAASEFFIKVVRPSRVDDLVDKHSVLARADTSFDVPTVLEANPDGRVALSRVAGRSLHQQIRDEPMRPLDDIGELVAALHATPIPSRLSARVSDDPLSWVATSRRAPTAHLPAIELAAEQLPPLADRAEVVVHGDLHDKNILCDPTRQGVRRGRLGLIDLDGLGLGAPEDDIANLAAHLELRNLQARSGLCPGARSQALYRSYQRIRPLDPERLCAVERHTWFRLACLYQYRAASNHLVPQLLRATSEQPGQTTDTSLPPRSLTPICSEGV